MSFVQFDSTRLVYDLKLVGLLQKYLAKMKGNQSVIASNKGVRIGQHSV
jgi:hypothetical protein